MSEARLSRDRLFSILAILMWGGTAVKCFKDFTPWENANALTGLAAIVVISAAWPTLYPTSYVKRRVPALAFLQLFLFALPFNFSTKVFDVLAPHPGRGYLALVLNVFQLAMSIRIALLLFTSIGWRLPLHVQLPVQAAKVAMLMVFGTRNYCHSKLLSSPEMEAVFHGAHRLMAFLGTPLMPLTPASVIVPEGAFARRVAILLLLWLVLGWLVPALLLLPNSENRAQRGTQGSAPRGARLLALLESGLRMLLPAQVQQSELPAGLMCGLRWWVLVQLLWGACCVVAPLFGPH
ncbi:MAG: hypothetical protein J3K34DRAFT_164422 [Monoraphidium minutum]|nr:MAG: hypothetical protein J3K34DRAFT_164422 [Monoraphidium minutum]